MAGALPPGAWWEYSTAGTAPPKPEAYGLNAGATLIAAGAPQIGLP